MTNELLLHDNPHNIDPNVNMDKAKMNTLFVPKVSIKNPVKGITAASAREYALNTHFTLLRSTWNISMSFGIAIFTILVSSIVIKVPNIMTVRASHLLFFIFIPSV